MRRGSMLILSNRQNKIFLILSVSVTLFVFSGCESSTEGRDMRVMAKINNYELTVEDFKNEIDPTLIWRYLPEDLPSAKERLLQDLITKKVLLQEAQRQKLDKDKAFMKEIERHWEQALLKLLLKNKSNEFARDIDESGGPEAFEKWIKDLKESASIEIDKTLLDEIQINKD